MLLEANDDLEMYEPVPVQEADEVPQPFKIDEEAREKTLQPQRLARVRPFLLFSRAMASAALVAFFSVMKQPQPQDGVCTQYRMYGRGEDI